MLSAVILEYLDHPIVFHEIHFFFGLQLRHDTKNALHLEGNTIMSCGFYFYTIRRQKNVSWKITEFEKRNIFTIRIISVEKKKIQMENSASKFLIRMERSSSFCLCHDITFSSISDSISDADKYHFQ